jgi:hypothetical protein
LIELLYAETLASFTLYRRYLSNHKQEAFARTSFYGLLGNLENSKVESMPL